MRKQLGNSSRKPLGPKVGKPEWEIGNKQETNRKQIGNIQETKKKSSKRDNIKKGKKIENHQEPNQKQNQEPATKSTQIGSELENNQNQN